MITTKQVDKLIKSKSLVELIFHYGENHTVKIVSRDRWCFNCEAGERFEQDRHRRSANGQ